MKTGVIYARYSSDTQTEQSIEGQLRVCNDYAKNNDILILRTYIDRAMTGTNDNRPDFRQMIEDSKKHDFNVVLVYKFDRFSRNKYETTKHKKTLKDNGVKVVSATEYIPDSPEAIILESMIEGYAEYYSAELSEKIRRGILIEGVLESMAEYYSAELSQKVKRGMNETRQKGNFTGGTIIYGYKVENHKVVIDEEKAEVVRFIYDQYAQGVYVKDIIKTLTERGIFNRGKKFARNTVYNILKNEKYSGIYRHGNEVFTNMYPQIVPTAIYENVRRKTETNKYGTRSVEVVYLLRNKIKCGYCGSPISAECGTAKNGQKIRYYKCLGRKHQSGCKKTQVRKEILEKYVLDNVCEQMQRPEILDKMVTYLLQVQENRIKQNSVLTNLIKEKRQTENTINNIMQAIELGGQSATVMKRMRELEEKLTDIEKRLTIEKSQTAFRLSKEQIIDYYKSALEKEPLQLINYFVKEIQLYDDKMIIIYNTPNTINLDESQGFSFYDKNVKMPYVIQNREYYGLKDFILVMRI